MLLTLNLTPILIFIGNPVLNRGNELKLWFPINRKCHRLSLIIPYLEQFSHVGFFKMVLGYMLGFSREKRQNKHD